MKLMMKNYTYRGIANHIFITLFITMLILPLVFVDLSSDRVSIEENRMLASSPDLADIKNHPKTFIRSFDEWFKDSTGFREQLLELYNIAKNKLPNGDWYTDGKYPFLVGEQGHHFYAGGRVIPVFQGRKIITDEQLMIMADKLEEIKIYLDRKNIPLIVMFCTMKESIYPEYFPKSIRRGPEPIQLDVITKYLNEHTSVDVFNIRKALLEEKNKWLLYPLKGDANTLAHYNLISGFFAYCELMKHINIHFPEMIPYGLKDIDIKYDDKGNPLVYLKKEKVYQKIDPSFFDDVKYDKNVPLPNESLENADPNLPVILLLRDSYASEGFIGRYIAQHFGKTIMLHFLNMEYIEEYITKYNPDIVVFETTEHQLGNFSDSVSKIHDLP
jgi:hypothetical protein